MYVDSVYVKHFQEVAQLISPKTTAPMSGCLSFYYQLQQGNDNSFSLYTRDGAGLYEEIWKVGQPGSAAWNLAEVEFSAPYPMEVGMEAGAPWPQHCALGGGASNSLSADWETPATLLHSSLLCVHLHLPFPSVGPLCFSLFLSFPCIFLLSTKTVFPKDK